MQDQELIEIEVNRLKGLPQKGHFTCLHHASALIERSDDLMERVEYILENKPKDEILLRLKNIHYVAPERYTEYEKVLDAAWEKHEKVRDAAWEEYKKVLDASWAGWEESWKEYEKVRDAVKDTYNQTILSWLNSWVPFTTWNGKSIFND